MNSTIKQKSQSPEPALWRNGKNDAELVQSLKKGFAVLRCFTPGDHLLGNKDLAQRTGLPRSTIARFTATLVDLGYLQMTPDSKYRLTSAVLELGFSFLANFDIRGLIRPYLQEVADFSFAGCSIGAPDDLNMLYIEQCRSRVVHITVNISVGSKIPIASTAMGHAYLAGLQPAERSQMMKVLRLANPRDWPRLRRRIERSINDINSRGFCAVLGTWQPGVNAVGVPLVSRNGQYVFGVTCAAPSSILPEKRIVENVGPKLVEVMNSASTMIL